MLHILQNSTAGANNCSAMEADTISKNGRSSKSQTSRKNRRFLYILTLCFTLFLVSSCGSSSSFVKGEGGWTTVQIADRISYDLAFDEVSSILTKKFEMDMISKEAGYLRTSWKTNWVSRVGQRPQKDYRVRVTIKMSETRKKIDINAEAEKRKGHYWVSGYDAQLLETIRKDIAGSVGF